MRTLVMMGLVLVSSSSCAPKHVELPRVEVPNTPEGLTCQRECLIVFHSCHAGNSVNLHPCRGEQLRCLRLCPGATQDDLPIDLDEVTRY